MTPAQIMCLLEVHAWMNEPDEDKRDRMRDGRGNLSTGQVLVTGDNADLVLTHLSSMKLTPR